MTVGVGFQSQEFVLLCADTEISYGMSGKGQGCKIHILSDSFSELPCACVYAGDVDYMEQVLPSLERVCRTNPKKILHRLGKECDAIFQKSRKRAQRGIEFPWVQLLFAIGLKTGPKLYSSNLDLFKQKRKYDVIGIGSDVARTVIEPAYREHPPLSRTELLLLAAGGIKQAKDFVQGCGKKTQCLVLDSSSSFFGGPLIDELSDFESDFEFFREQSSKLLLAMADMESEDSDFDEKLNRFTDSLNSLRKRKLRDEDRIREEISKPD